MALFSFFIQEKRFSDFSESLRWGLDDKHPWVRRSAAEFFLELESHSDDVNECFFSMQFDNKYPGILDFYLTSPASLHSKIIQHIKDKNILLEGDIRCLSQSFLCE